MQHFNLAEHIYCTLLSEQHKLSWKMFSIFNKFDDKMKREMFIWECNRQTVTFNGIDMFDSLFA